MNSEIKKVKNKINPIDNSHKYIKKEDIIANHKNNWKYIDKDLYKKYVDVQEFTSFMNILDCDLHENLKHFIGFYINLCKEHTDNQKDKLSLQMINDAIELLIDNSILYTNNIDKKEFFVKIQSYIDSIDYE